jgi:nicotinate-nucleotide adenylyltransferase
MKIGLYFGSFNPIHVGHLIIANHVANNTNLNQVWLVVSPQNPFKPSNSLLNEYDRLHLVNLAIEGNAQLKATDIEFKLPKPSYTIDTLTYLQEKYPSYQFSIIMGSDSF